MRTILIAAMVAAGSLIAVQASALAQGASAYPNTDPVFTTPAPDSGQMAPQQFGRSGVRLYNEVRPEHKARHHAQ